MAKFAVELNNLSRENGIYHLCSEHILSSDNSITGYRVALYDKIQKFHIVSDIFTCPESAQKVYDFYNRHSFK